MDGLWRLGHPAGSVKTEPLEQIVAKFNKSSLMNFTQVLRRSTYCRYKVSLLAVQEITVFDKRREFAVEAERANTCFSRSGLPIRWVCQRHDELLSPEGFYGEERNYVLHGAFIQSAFQGASELAMHDAPAYSLQ
jgi:hypothetical protein